MKRFNAAKALKNEEAFYRPVEKAILYILTELIYKPLFDIVKEEITAEWVDLELPKVIKARQDEIKDGLKAEIKRNKEDYSYLYHNAKMKDAMQDPVVKSILRGKVQYVRDHFEGKFSAEFSREIKKMGGVWDWRRQHWKIPVSKLSPQVSLAIGTASDKISRLKSRISNHLNEVSNIISQDPKFTFNKAFEQTVKGLNKKFEEGIEGIVIAPEFTPEMVKNITEQYSDNMNLYIKGWTEKSIKRLRGRVLVNTFEGNRAEHLVRELEHDYNISFNKAKFLARQETSLLMSQFREERYKSCGITKYRWITAGDERVRPYHKRLNGKIFTWDNPPVVDEMGNRAAPGQPYGCRCLASPILE